MSVTGLAAARADQSLPKADLVCSARSNTALVRFGMADEGDTLPIRRLPAAIDDGLSARRAGERTDCRLPNGHAVRIRMGVGQSFAYGMGGADSPAFFSLWIDGRVVLSRKQWKPGYEKDFDPWTAAVVIRDSSLTFCTATDDEGPLRCRATKFDLAAKRRDLVEYPADGRKPLPAGTWLLAASAPDPKLCRHFLDGARPKLDKIMAGWDDEAIFDAKLDFKAIPAGPNPFAPRVALASIERGGRTYRLAMFSAETHYFDGDIAVIAPAAATDPELTALSAHDEDKALAPWPAGWIVISGGQPGLYPKVSSRYVHLTPLRIDGRLYFLAHPTNKLETPPAQLVGVGADLKPRVVCVFNQVEANFG
ncbi:MAG TPA: hypothetical protein VNW53_10105 [Phenylobacterium sp.]|jgi:hypothetical protein|uniref:hypothetical protein n=1 Tax=Phenylobacterium sp. TaxID=1871053 RepID=UPI002CCF9ACF|nr:hypothetical protein [Phenylobacterium sp.]HXA39344.1 hypothetical protein [Phenylobacterium sp.]